MNFSQRIADIVIMNDNDLAKKENGFRGYVTNIHDLNLTTNPVRYFPKGLYDPYIFGNLGRCLCSLNHRKEGTRCPRCNCEVMEENKYLTSYALYKLPIPYVNFLNYEALKDILTDLFGYLPNKCNSLRDFWSLYVYINDEVEGAVNTEINKYRLANGKTETSVEGDYTVERIQGSVRTFFDKNGTEIKVKLGEIPESNEINDKERLGLMGLSYLSNLYNSSGVANDKLKYVIHHNLIISSPGLRPLHKFPNGYGGFTITVPQDTINYRAIISYGNKIFKMKKLSLVDYATHSALLNTMINKHISENELLQPSKQSLVRNIVSTRVSKSLRAGIVSSLDCRMDEIKLPRELFYATIQHDIIKELTSNLIEEREGDKNKTLAIEDAKRLYREKDIRAVEICEELSKTFMCKITRNPSLHKFSQFAFNILLWDEPFIGLPIAVDEGLNADHDGDTIAVWIYSDPKHIAKLKTITPGNLWFYDKRFQSPFNYKHETLYGLYLATVVKASKKLKVFNSLEDAEKAYKEDIIKVNQEIKIGNNITTYGRAKISYLAQMDIDKFLQQNPGLPNKSNHEALYVKYKNPDGINSANVGAFVASLGYNINRVEIYRQIQIFANEIATTSGFGSIPYQNLYKGDRKVTESILKDTSLSVLERKSKLQDYYTKEIRKSMKELPDSNINEFEISAGKLSLGKMVEMYAPQITGSVSDTLSSNESDILFFGLSERSYVSMAEHDRQTLVLKQKIVPLGGYLQRQLNDLAQNIKFKVDERSDDEYGVMIDGKYAEGRTDVKTGKVYETPVVGKVWVKSFATSNNYTTVCGDEIAYGFNNNKRDSSKYKFTATDNSGIGASFASSIAENLQQSALGFKHGGSLENLNVNYIKAIEDCQVVDINDRFVTVENINGRTYKYLITSCCSLMDNVQEQAFLQKGEPIAKRIITEYPDDTVMKVNTMIDADVAGTKEDFGAKTYKTASYSVSSGKINYTPSSVIIGGYEYPIDDREIYYYPSGYNIEEGGNISTGVPDLKLLEDILNDRTKNGILFYIFYTYLDSIKSYKNFNPEVFELLFKCIKDNGYSVSKSLKNLPELLDRMNYGRSIINVSNSIREAIQKATPSWNKSVENKIKVDDVVKVELNKEAPLTKPTNIILNDCKNYKTGNNGNYVGLFKYLIEMVKDQEGNCVSSLTWSEVRDYLSQGNSKYGTMKISEVKENVMNWLYKDKYGSLLYPYVNMGRNLNLTVIKQPAKKEDAEYNVNKPNFNLTRGDSLLAGLMLGIRR